MKTVRRGGSRTLADVFGGATAVGPLPDLERPVGRALAAGRTRLDTPNPFFHCSRSVIRAKIEVSMSTLEARIHSGKYPWPSPLGQVARGQRITV